MYKYTFNNPVNNKDYTRIDKRAARRLYNAGKDILIIADNLRPFTPWHCETITNINNLDEWDKGKTDCFDRFVNMFEIYNCVSRETGYHAAFYKEV